MREWSKSFACGLIMNKPGIRGTHRRVSGTRSYSFHIVCLAKSEVLVLNLWFR